MSPYFQAGAGNLPLWKHPIQPRKRLAAIDSLSGTYYTDRATVLNPGDAVPGYPGMIIMDLDHIDTGVSIAYSIQAEGSLDNTLPTKLLSRSESRSISANFESIQEQKTSWQTARKAITGVASTDIITTTDGAHGFSDGQRFCFLSLTGGAGLTPQSLSTIAPVYFARDTTSTTLKAAATSGGSAVNFTTDISAGYLMAAEFFPGTPHSLWPTMYLSEVRASDNGTPWRIADCTYIGKMWDKPYHRVITVNGQQVSSADKVTLPGVTGGDSDLRYRSVELPEVIVTDTYVDVADLPTALIPSCTSPPNPPTIQSLTLSDDADLTVKQWPNEWSLVGTAHIETISSGISLTIYSKTFRYKWPYLPK
jgi:hypothetical protein